MIRKHTLINHNNLRRQAKLTQSPHTTIDN